MSRSSTFQYAYKLPKTHLRLLQPVKIGPDGLSFRLILLPRCKRSKYAAISYTWGEEEPTETIFIDDQRLQVRPHLWQCLYSLSTQVMGNSHITYLWIDAVCINQTDTRERNEQVRRMRETYSQAIATWVWLGGEPGITKWSPMLKSTRPDKAFFEKHLDDLANRPYWTRRWIIQEFLVSQVVLVFCGSRWVHWFAFATLLSNAAARQPSLVSSAASLLGDADPLVEMGNYEFWHWGDGSDLFRAKPIVVAKYHLVNKILAIRNTAGKVPKKAESKAYTSLYHLLVSHQHTDCRDPRDRVFALLGLVSPQEQMSLPGLPNYALQHRDVVVLTLAHLISRGPSMFLADNAVFSGYLSLTQYRKGPDGIDIFHSLGAGSMPEPERLEVLAEAYERVGIDLKGISRIGRCEQGSWPLSYNDEILDALGAD